MFKKIILITFFLFVGIDISFANNLKLSNFDVSATNVTTHTMSFQFDISQSNSWRNMASHDAVWIFMKYSVDAGQTWHHATMAGKGLNPVGFSVPSGYEIIVPSDNKGLFLRRSNVSSGNIAIQAAKFVWDYGQDGLSDAVAKAANTLTRLYGIEMVYIPTGAFFAGDGASSSEFSFKKGSADDSPWYISSENAITTANSASGGYYYQSSSSGGENATGAVFLVPNSFPKGYNGFYLMKYELTEGEWVSFFNTLSSAARLKRDVTGPVDGGKNSDDVVNRNTVSWSHSNPLLKAETLRPARAMTYISWPDAAAFADWSGLRPITELEFEKAARGVDIAAVADEYAWGTTAYRAAGADEIFPPNADEIGTEAILDGTANLNRNTLGWGTGDGRVGGPAQGQQGPLRVGIFAENATGRTTSGAGYYGNMELSGNVSEPAVTIGRPEGRQFLGTHGDGELSDLAGFEGNATNVDWPGIDVQDSRRGITGTVGIGYRGGDYKSASLRNFQVSSRAFAAKDPDSEGVLKRFDVSSGIVYGARFARTAP